MAVSMVMNKCSGLINEYIHRNFVNAKKERKKETTPKKHHSFYSDVDMWCDNSEALYIALDW